jgi:hypothetical protein
MSDSPRLQSLFDPRIPRFINGGVCQFGIAYPTNTFVLLLNGAIIFDLAQEDVMYPGKLTTTAAATAAATAATATTATTATAATTDF